jgi:hypothetical protein
MIEDHRAHGGFTEGTEDHQGSFIAGVSVMREIKSILKDA